MTPSTRRPTRLTTLARPTVPSAEGWRPRKIWAFGAADEPSLMELMADPIFGHLLASDGVRQEHVETLINEMRYKLGYV